MKGVSLPSMSSLSQGLAAASVYGSRLMVQAEERTNASLERGRRVIREVNADTMAEFIVRPEVRQAGCSAVAAGAAFGIPHLVENTVAGTAAMKDLGQRLMRDFPRIGRALQRNPNAALVAGTVAFPYVVAPLLERWFKELLSVQRAPGAGLPDWRPGFMATVLNWNTVQPLLNEALVRHPALLIMAGPLATGLLNAGVDAINTLDAHARKDAAVDVTAGAGAVPTAEEQATGRVVACQTRYFTDTVRQALRRHPHVQTLTSEAITSSLYPGWVAALSNLYARHLASRMAGSRELGAADPADAPGFSADMLDIESMLRSEGVTDMLAMLAARNGPLVPETLLRPRGSAFSLEWPEGKVAGGEAADKGDDAPCIPSEDDGARGLAHSRADGAVVVDQALDPAD